MTQTAVRPVPEVRPRRSRTSPVFDLLALFGDMFTDFRLDYRGAKAKEDDSRFTAGARIATAEGAIIPYTTPGYYSVASDDRRFPMKRYDVCALPGFLSCECWDVSTHSHQIGLCKHLIAVLMRKALDEVDHPGEDDDS
jgi:hypothetical protein